MLYFLIYNQIKSLIVLEIALDGENYYNLGLVLN